MESNGEQARNESDEGTEAPSAEPSGGRPDLGTVDREGDLLKVTYVRGLPADVTRVWRALTDSEDLRHWFPADIDISGDREPGAHMTFRFWPEHLEAGAEQLEAAGEDGESEMPGELLAWTPEETFDFLWDSERLLFDLEPVGPDSTRLTFSTWLAADGPWAPEGTMTGWHACLHALESLLRTGEGEEPSQDQIDALTAEYSRVVAALGVRPAPDAGA